MDIDSFLVSDQLLAASAASGRGHIIPRRSSTGSVPGPGVPARWQQQRRASGSHGLPWELPSSRWHDWLAQRYPAFLALPERARALLE